MFIDVTGLFESTDGTKEIEKVDLLIPIAAIQTVSRKQLNEIGQEEHDTVIAYVCSGEHISVVVDEAYEIVRRKIEVSLQQGVA